MKKNILIIAYAANPNKHSEHRVGYKLLRRLAEADSDNHYYVFTRKKNVAILTERLVGENVTLIGFELPLFICRIKSKFSLDRLYYYFWSVLGGIYISRYFREKHQKIDLIHHITFVCDWLPSAGWLLSYNTPFIFGPVGTNDYSFVKDKNYKFLFIDLIKTFIRKFDIFYHLTLKNADVIISITEKVASRFRESGHYVVLHPAIGIDSRILKNEKKLNVGVFKIIFVGRLIEIKRPLLFLEIADELVKTFENVHVTMVGSGPFEERIVNHPSKLYHHRRFNHIAELDHSDCLEKINDSDVMIFTSFEQAGFVGLEALGLRTIFMCSDEGFLGSMSTYNKLCTFSEAPLEDIKNEVCKKISGLVNNRELCKRLTLQHFKIAENLTWESKTSFYLDMYRELIGNE